MKDSLTINIGRQIGSGGCQIAKILSKEFNCNFFDKEILNLAAKESGFCKSFFEENDEQKGFMKSMFQNHIPLFGENNFQTSTISQENLFQFQSDAIRKAAEEDNCVFVGRCADYVLRDKPNTVNIFITADIEDRVKRVMMRHQCSEEEARKCIHKQESERSSYYNYYTGKKWGHSDSYDLCINTSPLGVEETTKILSDYIKKRFEIE